MAVKWECPSCHCKNCERRKKSGMKVLELVEKSNYTEEEATHAFEELKKMRKELERW